jgi:hypothetical protein
VRVDVDDAGSQRQTARVDALASGPQVDADGGDTTTRHRHAARARRAANAVVLDGVGDHEIVHGTAYPCITRPPSMLSAWPVM